MGTSHDAVVSGVCVWVWVCVFVCVWVCVVCPPDVMQKSKLQALRSH